MRKNGSLGLAAAAALVATISATGCYSLGSDCDFKFGQDCAPSGGGGGAGGTMTGGGGTGGAPPTCVPSNNSNPVDNECGVFVSPTQGDDTFEGTKEKPYATITNALLNAGGKPVYLCGEGMLETLEVGQNTTFYGGLDCTKEWKYDADKPTQISASGDTIVISVTGQTRASFHDIDIRAEDAMIEGGSSIAMIAEAGSDVSLTRVTLHAGNGANGDSGAPYMDGGVEGMTGADGGVACSAGTVITMDPPTNRCGDIDSVGGPGGLGGATFAAPGGAGEPQGTMNGGQAEGAAVCTAGTDGDPGTTGDPGDGSTSDGTLQAGLGYVGTPGGDGKSGTPGQGGGGGGGAKGGMTACMGQIGNGGASGGAGGSGGCGGAGGRGGKAGGSSIGIVSLGAKLTFSNVTIETKTGGQGGNGGLGQLGGMGGLGGLGGSKGSAISLNNGCKGGNGGAGGTGGKGGGGRGGHTLGIAHVGGAPETTGVTITTGTPGNGGQGEGPNGSGSPGLSAKVQSFK